MLKKLSCILGVFGGALLLILYVSYALPKLTGYVPFSHDILFTPSPYVNNWSVLNNMPRSWGEPARIAIIVIAAVFSSAGLIASLFVRRKPLIAGVIMAASSCLVFMAPDNLIFPHDLSLAVRFLSAVLLITAGVLAFISARRTPVSDKPQG